MLAIAEFQISDLRYFVWIPVASLIDRIVLTNIDLASAPNCRLYNKVLSHCTIVLLYIGSKLRRKKRFAKVRGEG